MLQLGDGRATARMAVSERSGNTLTDVLIGIQLIVILSNSRTTRLGGQQFHKMIDMRWPCDRGICRRRRPSVSALTQAFQIPS